MKITGIKTLVVNAQLRNWVFFKVETDVPGLYGWGEETLEWKTRDVAGCVEGFKPLVLQEILEQMVFHPDGSVAE
jgi:galactonate dehydratase